MTLAFSITVAKFIGLARPLISKLKTVNACGRQEVVHVKDHPMGFAVGVCDVRRIRMPSVTKRSKLASFGCVARSFPLGVIPPATPTFGAACVAAHTVRDDHTLVNRHSKAHSYTE